MLALLWASNAFPQTAPAVDCTALVGRTIPQTVITSASAVTGGSFTPPGAATGLGDLPPFCRVAGVIAPTATSAIRFEVWMPLAGWNGKFAGVGNGGWAGSISYGGLAAQLRRGYATASTNTGHEAVPGEDAAVVAMRADLEVIASLQEDPERVSAAVPCPAASCRHAGGYPVRRMP